MTGWAAAHATATAWLCALVFAAACAGLVLLAVRRLRQDEWHAGAGMSRDEETAALFARMNRPAEIASDAALYAADPLTKAALAVTAEEAAYDESAWYHGGAEALETVVTLAEAQAAPFRRWERDTYVGAIPVVRDEHGLVKPAFDTSLIDAGTAAGAS